MEDVFYDVQILTSKRKVVIIITRLSIDSIGLSVYRSGSSFKSFRIQHCLAQVITGGVSLPHKPSLMDRTFKDLDAAFASVAAAFFFHS